MLRTLMIRPLLAIILALLGLSACGGDNQPHIYRIAINKTPLQALPQTCFNRSPPNVTPDTDLATSFFAEQQWTIWKGDADKRYLALGDMSEFKLGDADRVQLSGDIIEEGPQGFSTQRTLVDSNGSRTRVYTATAVFAKEGDVAQGTLFLKSTCNICTVVSCEVTLDFNGRRLEAYPEVTYSAGSQ